MPIMYSIIVRYDSYYSTKIYKKEKATHLCELKKSIATQVCIFFQRTEYIIKIFTLEALYVGTHDSNYDSV